MSLPQAAVALVRHGEDVRRQLPHLVFAVQSNCSGVVEPCYLLIRVHCCQDGADVGLRAQKTQVSETMLLELVQIPSANVLESGATM